MTQTISGIVKAKRDSAIWWNSLWKK